MVTGEALAFHAFFLLEIPVRIVKKLANRSDAGTFIDDYRQEGDLSFSFLLWRWALDLLHRVDR